MKFLEEYRPFMRKINYLIPNKNKLSRCNILID